MDINNQAWAGFLQNIKESSIDPAILQAVGTAASLTEDLAKKKMKDAAQLLPESSIHGIRSVVYMMCLIVVIVIVKLSRLKYSK